MGRVIMNSLTGFTLAILACLSIPASAWAQEQVVQLPSIREELAVRCKEDQDTRRKLISAMRPQADGSTVIPDGLLKKMNEVDERNTAWLKSLVERHGWLGKSLVGEKAAHEAWLLVQHADKQPKFQRLCLDLMKDMPPGEVAGKDIAYLTDRVLLAEGKPQLYGTQLSMKNGKAELLEVDDRKRLDERREKLGLSPIAEYMRFVEQVPMEETAGEQADAAKYLGTPEELAQWFQKNQQPFLAQGNMAHLFYETDLPKVSAWVAGSLVEFELLPGTRIWHGQQEFEGLSAGVVSYSFVLTREDGTTERVSKGEYRWRGPKAPQPPAVKSESLQGKLAEYELESSALATKTRKITVYLPPMPSSDPFVVYMTDGTGLDDFARILEPLILEQRLPPIVLVGVHNGGYLGKQSADFSDYDMSKDLRAAEYLPEIQSEHFAGHEAFFINEVSRWAEKEFGVSSSQEHKVLFGCSNGARFVAEMGIKHADQYGHVIACSIAAGKPPSQESLADVEQTNFTIAAGRWETMFHKGSLAFHQALEEAGSASKFVSRVSGHEQAMWEEEFANALLSAFGKSDE